MLSEDRLRVLVLALVSLALLIGALLVMDWFTIEVAGGIGRGGTLAIDLRSVHACDANGVCGSAPVQITRSMYSVTASITFWTGLLFVAAVVLQAGSRLITDHANPSITRIGQLVGVIAILTGFATAYFFGPELDGLEMFGITASRTFAPLMLIAGAVLGIAAMHYAGALDSTLTATDRPILTTASPPSPAAEAAAPESAVPVATQDRPSAPQQVPDELRGKLSFAALTADITRGGIDARREDGKTILVVWRDVVGAVARRLPPEYDGAPFIDVVSTAGSTLRILPWTRLSGDAVTGATDSERTLGFLELVIGRCPELRLDPATRAFVEERAHPAQLPDVATLAAHDQRLA